MTCGRENKLCVVHNRGEILVVCVCCEHTFSIFPDVQPTNKEIETGTETTISCIITGITQQLDAVVRKKDGTDVRSLSGSNYIVSAGTYSSNSQTTTLTVKAAANTADSTYTCVITSDEWRVSNKETNVILNVFGKNVIFYCINHKNLAISRFAVE